MSSSHLNPAQAAAVVTQVGSLLERSPAWRGLPARERDEIRRNTEAVAVALAEQRFGAATTKAQAAPADRYARLGVPRPTARPFAAPAPATTLPNPPPKDPTFKAEGIAAGVTQAARMVREIDFPAFVAQLVTGTFDAVVRASIDQMKAYGELVRSVAMSLNEFRDQNVSMNQGRDNLVQRYPTLFEISTDGDGNPKVSARSGAENAQLPNFRSDLGLSEDVDGIDDDTIEQVLVPAARDNYARNRQKLLATTVLMGINRIIVTDGRINAKVQFTFKAQDKMSRRASATDYENLGTTRIEQGMGGASVSSDGTSTDQQPTYDDQGNLIQSGAGNRYATGDYQRLEMPVIKVAETSETNTDASVSAAGMLMGEVSLNFKSDVFPLERMVDTTQLMQLNAIQNAPAKGTLPATSNVPPAAAPDTAPAPPAPAAPAPATR